MNQNTTAYTYLERHYHEWTNISSHTYTREQLHAGDIPATLYKGFNQTKGFVLKDKQQEARKRQWTWCTDVRIKQPPQVRSYVGETAVDWKDTRVKMNKKHRSAYPGGPVSSLCYLPGPGWSQASTPRRHVFIHVFQTDVGLLIHTDNVTRSYCSTPSFGRRQTPVLSSCLKVGANPERWGHLLQGGMKGGETETPK